MHNFTQGSATGSKPVKTVAVDIRALAETWQSGVGEYVRNLIARLPVATPDLQYRYFFNAAKPARHPTNSAPNVSVVAGRVPSKLFNGSVRLLGFPHLDQVCKSGIIFLPSLQSVAPTKTARLLLTIHDLSFERYPEFFSTKSRLWHRLVNPQGLCRRANAIITLSQHSKRELVERYHVTPEKIAVTYLGVAPEFFMRHDSMRLAAVREKYHLPERYVLCLGNLEPRKNFLSAIDAFHRLKTDAELVIAGNPVYRADELRHQAAQGPAKDRIRFLGYVDAADRPALYQLATCFVYPSFYEGFGLPVLEAMAAGTPVVASAATCLPELVGDCGLLVDPYDVSDIAGGIEALLNNESLCCTFRERGKSRARQFTWETTVEQTADVIRRLAAT